MTLDYLYWAFLITAGSVVGGMIILLIWTLIDAWWQNRLMSKRMLTQEYRMNNLGTSETIWVCSDRAAKQIEMMRNHYHSIGDGLSARAMDGALKLVRGEHISFDHADAFEALAKADNPQPERPVTTPDSPAPF